MHTAFSAFLFFPDGTLVLQRSLSKPAVWMNSCRGVLAAHEDVRTAVARAAERELGLSCTDLRLLLPDESLTVIADEPADAQCAVVTGRVHGTVHPDSGRVIETARSAWHDFLHETWRMPHRFYTPTRQEALLLEASAAFKQFAEGLPQNAPVWASAPFAALSDTLR